MDRETDQDIYQRLLAQGTPQEEIDEVYRKLRQAGYGEEAARARLEASLRRMREQRAISDRRAAAGRSALRTGAATEHETTTGNDRAPQRRMEDWFPDVPASLRRKVNKWAYQKRLRITGVRERWHDFISIFRPSTPDLVSRSLLPLLARRKHYLSENPYNYSLATTVDALYTVSRTFLGRSGGKPDRERAVGDALRRRDPFACEYLSRFAHFDESLRQSLAYLELAMANNTDIPVAALARITRETYRLVLTTELVPTAKVDSILTLAKEVLPAYGGHDGYGLGLDDAAVIFQISLENLQRFKLELYPVVVKAIKSFYEYEDPSPEKQTRMLAFLGLDEHEILTVQSFYREEARRKEQFLAEQQVLQLERVEREKEASFATRFEGVRKILGALFPDSGIESLEQAAYLVPYFDERVFVNSLPFDHGSANVEMLSRFDPLQPVIVLHRIVDNLLSAVDHVRLEAILGREDVAEALAEIKSQWTRVYESIFTPYLKSLNEYARGLADESYARAYLQTTSARRLEVEINRLRNLAIRNYGHVAGGTANATAVRLWSIVERLILLLDETGQELHPDLAKRTDPLSRRVYEALGSDPVVDFREHATPGTADFKPVIRQLRRYIEAKYHSSLASIPRVAQLFLLDVMRGVVELYGYLLSDEASPLRAAGSRVLLAGDEEAAVWRQERQSRGTLTERLRIRLDEHLSSEYTDALTGLKTKNYYLQKLPALYGKIAQSGKSLSVLLVDIDHFKWVNDELGHQRGDDVLRDASTTLLDSVRRGSDVAIRYGGEELMIVSPMPLHNAIVLAERLRHAQEQHVAERDLYAPVVTISEQRGEPCATFSVGVVERGADESLESCVERADKALYQSKQTRNAVTIGHGGPGKAPRFERFGEYSARVRRGGNGG
ncbi:MAG: diguanylate cyclase [Spirochaetota bacterium]